MFDTISLSQANPYDVVPSYMEDSSANPDKARLVNTTNKHIANNIKDVGISTLNGASNFAYDSALLGTLAGRSLTEALTPRKSKIRQNLLKNYDNADRYIIQQKDNKTNYWRSKQNNPDAGYLAFPELVGTVTPYLLMGGKKPSVKSTGLTKNLKLYNKFGSYTNRFLAPIHKRLATGVKPLVSNLRALSTNLANKAATTNNVVTKTGTNVLRSLAKTIHKAPYMLNQKSIAKTLGVGVPLIDMATGTLAPRPTDSAAVDSLKKFGRTAPAFGALVANPSMMIPILGMGLANAREHAGSTAAKVALTNNALKADKDYGLVSDFLGKISPWARDWWRSPTDLAAINNAVDHVAKDVRYHPREYITSAETAVINPQDLPYTPLAARWRRLIPPSLYTRATGLTESTPLAGGTTLNVLDSVAQNASGIRLKSSIPAGIQKGIADGVKYSSTARRNLFGSKGEQTYNYIKDTVQPWLSKNYKLAKMDPAEWLDQITTGKIQIPVELEPYKNRLIEHIYSTISGLPTIPNDIKGNIQDKWNTIKDFKKRMVNPFLDFRRVPSKDRVAKSAAYKKLMETWGKNAQASDYNFMHHMLDFINKKKQQQ